MKKLIRCNLIHSGILAFLFVLASLGIGCSDVTDNTNLLSYKDSRGLTKPVKTVVEWEQKREQILDSMQAVMGNLPDRSNLPPFDILVTDSSKNDAYSLYRINFVVAENERVPANLYVPIQKGNEKKHPAMLALFYSDPNGKSGAAGKGQNSYWAYAKELAQRGYVVIAPDYPGYGDLKDYNFNTDRYESGTMKSIFDDMRCIDLLETRSDVDPERIGVIGLSLAGHSSMFVGAFDTRLKVIVSSSGWTLMDYYNLHSVTPTRNEAAIKKYGNRLGPWAQDVYMPLFRDKYKYENIPFDFDEVISALASRAFFSVSPLKDKNYDVKGVKRGIESASKVYRFLGTEDNLQVRYPDSGHGFSAESRIEAYGFIDKILNHIPTENFKIEDKD